MNVIDKILLEWSYRCEKGYPDLNNREDLKIFEDLFGVNLLNEINPQGFRPLGFIYTGLEEGNMKIWSPAMSDN